MENDLPMNNIKPKEMSERVSIPNKYSINLFLKQIDHKQK